VLGESGDSVTTAKPRNLIYLVAVGIDDQRFVTMAQWCVESLRRWGQFDGDIAILTDAASAELFDGLRKLAEIVAVDEALLWNEDHDRGRSVRFQMARLNVAKVIDLARYETVMYLDVDILAVKDVRPLFEAVTEFRYAREFVPMSLPAYSASLTAEELEEARWRRAINSGTFVAPAAVLGSCLEAWSTELNRSPAGDAYDQPALNAAILRNKFPSAPLAAMSVGFPIMTNFVDHYSDSTILLHYAGPTDAAMSLMERHVGELRAGQPLTIEQSTSAVQRHGLNHPRGRMTIGLDIDPTNVTAHEHVNRQWARELEARGHRIVSADASGGDRPDAIIHHSYERDFLTMDIRADIPHVAVRTSDFGPHPRAWVDHVNQHYDQLWVHTEWIRQHALDGGINPARIRLVPLGIDPQVFVPNGEAYELPTEASFRFLFVGGAIARKGIDVLLQAYTDEFSPDDDVCLVIKDSPTNVFYTDDAVRQQIRALADDSSMAEIIPINEHLPEHELASLFRSCTVGVWPYRAEGFLVPALECLACGTPTIVPEIGPTADFSSARTSFLVPAVAIRLPYSRRFEMRLGFEIDVDEINIVGIRADALARTMRRAFETEQLILKEMAANAVAMAHGRFTWRHSVDVAEQFLAEIVADQNP
jgi:glycosyltransferase involved in cell wall biosynthesis